MRIFIAGATGAVGSQLVSQLVARGHEVVGTTRSESNFGALRALGAEPVALDALDPDSVASAVAQADPEAIVHQMTALTGPLDRKSVKRMAAATNRLRTEGLDNLLAAGRAVGVRLFVAQSNASLLDRTVTGPVAEGGRQDLNLPADLAPAAEALRRLEDEVTSITWGDGIAIRYGGFYGRGTGLTSPALLDQIRARKFPVIGGGTGVWSMLHIDDAASVTVAAIERGRPGIYHAADDDPAPIGEILPFVADQIGAKRPRRVPAWLVRLVAGEGVVNIMTKPTGLSSEWTKQQLDWSPKYDTWRIGIPKEVG
jgi:2-alkyl-3-oxoalkanoate reductase